MESAYIYCLEPNSTASTSPEETRSVGPSETKHKHAVWKTERESEKQEEIASLQYTYPYLHVTSNQSFL